MAGAHALVQPSGLARTIQCPASLVMQKKHPGYGDDSAALEGEAAHWVAQHALAGDWAPVGSAAPNAVTVTEEMHEGAWEVLDTIAADLQPYDMGLGDVAVEVPVDIPGVHAECWGTPDYRCWVPANRTPNGRSRLYVWDYKFGHSPVEAFENPQLVAYASGALSATKVSDLDVDVTLVIIQPRTYHRSASAPSWSTTAVNLRALVNIASNAAHEALGDNPEAHTGPECLHCTARHACTLYQSTAYMAIDLAGAPQPLELPPDALGLELRLLTQAAERLKGRITGLQEQAMAVERAGRRVAWWKVERAQGRQVWTRPAAEVLALGSAMGVPLAKPAAVVTPKQAIEAGLPGELVAAYSTRYPGETALVPDDGAAARRVFG